MTNRMLHKLFISAPRKIVRFVLSLFECFFYHFIYTSSVINGDIERKRYLICGGEDFDNVGESYEKFFRNEKEKKVEQADLICEHIFDLLGSGPTKLSTDGEGYQPIDWHSDFKSRHRWNPNTFYRYIRYGHIEGVDIKVPWELSRFQHLNILGQTYILTKDKKYADEFENQINDWIDNNVVGFGVNWRCAMDIAIRASNWLVVQEYFIGEDVLSKEFWQKFYKSIYEHGRFIKSHLENQDKVTTNHYLSDLVGLFFITVYCPFFKESKDWQNFALSELSKEIENQVYPDGCSFEASTCYHRLVLELLFYAELLGQRTGVEFPKHYKDKVRKMFEFSLYCIKPNGMIPQIGDNDNGRFLIFSKRPILENKYLLFLATIYYQDSIFNLEEFGIDEESFWLFGLEGMKKYRVIPCRSDYVESKVFSDAGWCIMRHEDNYCFISCGSNGQGGNGGHAHNDKLSFELMLKGEDIIVDSGTHVYTSDPEERNKFRSTSYHNTLHLQDVEQNMITSKLFILTDSVKFKIKRFTDSEDKICFEGEIQNADYSHRRKITFYKDKSILELIDISKTHDEKKKYINFNLNPKLSYEDDNIKLRSVNRKIASIKSETEKIIKVKHELSLGYGEKSSNECLTMSITSHKQSSEVVTIIRSLL